MRKIDISIDKASEVAYFRLSPKKVSVTRNYSNSVNVDLDEAGEIVGIELLSLIFEIPYEQLAADFHLDSDTISQIRMAMSQLRK